jgi:hypothetical protein
MLVDMKGVALWMTRVVFVALVTVASLPHAHANDLEDFNRAVEAAMTHHRAAAAYLHEGNIELVTREIDVLREGWAKVATLPRPLAFRDQERYTSTILQVATQLVGISLVLNLGRVDVAGESLDKIRRAVSDLRRENGVTVLADCVFDANIAMDALSATEREPDWESAAAGAESLGATLRRCDAMAPRAIHDHAEFRRLAEGALASLAQFPKASEARDAALLHRLMNELRLFDNRLASSYG